MTREQIQEMMAKMPKPVSKYTEGSLVGYRWYDTKNVKPLYAFGHGLSYVDFEYGAVKAAAKKDVVKVTFNLPACSTTSAP